MVAVLAVVVVLVLLVVLVEVDVTVTVAEAVALPAEFCATRVYVVVVCGSTERDPLAGTLLPFKVTTVAFVVDHVRVLGWPEEIEVGDADRLAVGAGVACVVVAPADATTVTVADWVVLPAELVATRT